jgi:hypothetical protein
MVAYRTLKWTSNRCVVGSYQPFANAHCAYAKNILRWRVHCFSPCAWFWLHQTRILCICLLERTGKKEGGSAVVARREKSRLVFLARFPLASGVASLNSSASFSRFPESSEPLRSLKPYSSSAHLGGWAGTATLGAGRALRGPCAA